MSGSGRSRENHETTGQPVARLARSRVESWTAFTTVGTPADSASASSSAATRSFDSFGAGADPVASSIRWAAPRRSASSRWRTTFLAATREAISWRSWSMPWPVLALVAMTGTPVEAVGVEETADVGEHRLETVGRHRVDVVEQDQHHVAVGGERREVAVVDRGVGVLLRVEDPDHQVGELDQPVDLEVVGHLGGVVVGQVEQHHAAQGVVLAARVEHRVAHDAVARRDAEPVEEVLGRR